MRTYYYLNYLHREIFLEEDDIQAVPESGRADDACAAIAEKTYVAEQFRADSFQTLKEAVSRLCDTPDIRNRHDALMYIVWMAATTIKEERFSRHSSAGTKVLPDGFVWVIVPPDKIRDQWKTGTFALYRLYDDGSEAMIEDDTFLEETIAGGYPVGIEVDYAQAMAYEASK